jgi:hypothetical protein
LGARDIKDLISVHGLPVRQPPIDGSLGQTVKGFMGDQIGIRHPDADQTFQSAIPLQ